MSVSGNRDKNLKVSKEIIQLIKASDHNEKDGQDKEKVMKSGYVCARKEDFEKKTLSIYDRFKLMKDNISVEPIMICYIMPSVLAGLAVQNLNLEKACKVNLNYSDTVCTALRERDTEQYLDQERSVQKLIASVQAWKNAVQTAIPSLLILFVGAWSDRKGRRKACILMPIVGEFLSCMGFILNTYYFNELPVEVTAMTEAIFPAVTGGWFIMFLGVFSYVADITTKETRTFRVGVVNMFMTLGLPAGTALSGFLLKEIGYYGVFSVSAIMYLFAILYGCYFLEEPRKHIEESVNVSSFLNLRNVKEYTEIINKTNVLLPDWKINGKNNSIFFALASFFDLKSITETFKVVFKRGPGNRRLRVCLLIIVVCVVSGPMHGEYTVMYLFTRYRFNWDEVDFSLFSTYSIITNLLGTLFSISLFSHYLKYDDTVLGIISTISKIIAAFAYAFARTDFEIYMAPLLEILNGTAFIAMRSIATKLVDSEELGKVNSLFGLAEAMMPLVYGPMYSRVYMYTMTILPGAVFILGAVLTLPALFIFIWLYTEQKKATALNSQDVQEEVNSNETLALKVEVNAQHNFIQ